jgi:UDP-N-acetylglucosamine--N-acetylmuramyl-(pentapeptide) pyrophosphoryl-undecaprenol N-acetylglucosamine transferase
LTPALAVALALRSDRPDDEVAVVGRRDGVAERLVEAAGIRLETLEISGVDIGSAGGVARATTQVTRATIAARRLLRRMRPDVVVGAGGYVSVPVVVAALAQRIPVVLLEQNAVPGRATRMLARRARIVAASFAETASHLPHARVVHTGNPIRAEIWAVTSRPAGDRLRSVLVTGGSQGARRLNRAIAGCMVELLSKDPELRSVPPCGRLD